MPRFEHSSSSDDDILETRREVAASLEKQALAMEVFEQVEALFIAGPEQWEATDYYGMQVGWDLKNPATEKIAGAPKWALTLLEIGGSEGKGAKLFLRSPVEGLEGHIAEEQYVFMPYREPSTSVWSNTAFYKVQHKEGAPSLEQVELHSYSYMTLAEAKRAYVELQFRLQEFQEM